MPHREATGASQVMPPSQSRESVWFWPLGTETRKTCMHSNACIRKGTRKKRGREKKRVHLPVPTVQRFAWRRTASWGTASWCVSPGKRKSSCPHCQEGTPRPRASTAPEIWKPPVLGFVVALSPGIFPPLETEKDTQRGPCRPPRPQRTTIAALACGCCPLLPSGRRPGGRGGGVQGG